MKTIGVACAWVLSLVAAFFVGGLIAGETPEPQDDGSEETAELRERILELTTALEENRTARGRVDRSAGPARVTAKPDAETASAAEQPSADESAAPTFSLDGATSGAEASREFMVFAEAQLARGDEGGAAIMGAIADVWTNREMMKELFGDETQAVRQLYPWIKFLVHHETEVLGLTDYVFRTMAEDPKAFENIPDDDILEIFTEGVAILLPGAVDDGTLDVFRGYAETILATPESEQPEAIRGNRQRIERLLATFWAKPISPEEAFALLKSGAAPPAQIARLLRLVPPERMSDLDLGALVLPLLRAGNHEVIRILKGNRNANIDSWRTDQAVLDGLEAGKVHPWFLQQYFEAIGHKQWIDVRPFFDRALGAAEKSRTAALQALARYLQPKVRPDKAYVEDVLSRFEVDDHTAALLKRTYGIDD